MKYNCVTIVLVAIYIYILQEGSTALHWASEDGNVDIVRLLLMYGASIQIKDQVRSLLSIEFANVIVYVNLNEFIA